VTTHVARPKLFRLKGSEEHDCRTLAETSDSCTKHGFKMRFFLTVFSLQPIHLSSYTLIKRKQNEETLNHLKIKVYGGIIMKCPGQDIRYWKPGAVFDVKCPKCGKDVEFFKDDTTRKCRNCGHKFINPKLDFGCAAYCQYAAQCVGDLPEEYKAQREDTLKERIAVEMKKYFKKDFKRIGHAMQVARYAEKIGKNEGGDLAVILAAAYLHDIGIHEAARASATDGNHEKNRAVCCKIYNDRAWGKKRVD